VFFLEKGTNDIFQVRDIEHGTIPHNKQPKEVLKVKSSSTPGTQSLINFIISVIILTLIITNFTIVITLMVGRTSGRGSSMVWWAP